MSVNSGPNIVRDNLTVYLDAANSNSLVNSTSITWYDLSGNGNNASLDNGPVYNSEHKGSLVFDGSNDTFSIAHSNSLLNTLSTNSFTITSFSKASNLDYPKSAFPFWMQTFALNSSWAINNRGMSSGDGSNSTSFGIEVNDGGNYAALSFSHTVELNTIYCRSIVIERSSGVKIRYYVNGEYLGEGIANNVGGSIYTGGGLQFGNMYGWMFNGSIYNFMVHSKALTTSEVQQNYNALKGRFGL